MTTVELLLCIESKK